MFSRAIEQARKRHPAFDRVLARFESMHKAALTKRGHQRRRTDELERQLDAALTRADQRLTRLAEHVDVESASPAPTEKAGRHLSERVAQGPASIAGPAYSVQAELKGRK